MPGCPKHTKGFVANCPQCKKINTLLTRVAKDTVAGRKITYFHPFKKEDIEFKVQQLAEEAKAQEASPFCVRHFPNGGVRCHACLARQMTEQQSLHRDVQATIFGTPMPVRAEERQAADALVMEMRRSRATQAVSQVDVTSALLTAGYSPAATQAFVAELFATHDPDATGVVFLHDMSVFAQARPPRLLSHLALDGVTPAAIAHEFAQVDVDNTGGLCRQEVSDMLFTHGMSVEEAAAEAERWFTFHGRTHPQAEVSLGDVYSAYMRRHRQDALSRLKRICVQLFARCDDDGDGYLSLQEVMTHHAALLGARVHRAMVPQVFKRINVSGTGKVSANELFNWYYVEAGLHVEPSVPSKDAFIVTDNPVAGPPLKPAV